MSKSKKTDSITTKKQKKLAVIPPQEEISVGQQQDTTSNSDQSTAVEKKQEAAKNDKEGVVVKQKAAKRDRKKDIDQDKHWKEIIRYFFPEFLSFFLPTLYQAMDSDQEPEFLDKELHELIAEPHKKGKKESDLLVKVSLKTGDAVWILVHIEVQSYYDKTFPNRMYTYQYRIRDKYYMQYDKIIPLTAIALFTTPYGMPSHFSEECYGTTISYDYNTYWIKDQKEKKLLKSNNIFSLVVLAAFYTLQTKKEDKQRLRFKTKLIQLLLKREYEHKHIYNLFLFIHSIMNLTAPLALQFQQKIEKLNNMNATTTSSLAQTPESKEFMNFFVKAVYGKTIEDLQAAWELKAKQQVEAEKQKAEQETQKAEQAKQKAEAEKQQAEAEKQKAEAEKQQAEAEKRQAEAEKRQAEAEKQQAEQETQKAEQAKQKAEQDRQLFEMQIRKMAIKLYQLGSSIDEIAGLTQLDPAEINTIIVNHQTPPKSAEIDVDVDKDQG